MSMEPQAPEGPFPIPVKRLSGSERFHHLGRELDLSLIDFWRWSASSLIDNTLRGTLAEFLVASALGLASGVRVVGGWCGHGGIDGFTPHTAWYTI